MTDDLAVPDADRPIELSEGQAVRALALSVSRDTLSSRGVFAANNVNGWTVHDLMYLADWILEGREDESTEGEEEAPINGWWWTGYAEGVHAALASAGVPPESADAIKEALGVTAHHPAPDSGTR